MAARAAARAAAVPEASEAAGLPPPLRSPLSAASHRLAVRGAGGGAVVGVRPTAGGAVAGAATEGVACAGVGTGGVDAPALAPAVAEAGATASVSALQRLASGVAGGTLPGPRRVAAGVGSRKASSPAVWHWAL
jgi:hypothetical protein